MVQKSTPGFAASKKSLSHIARITEGILVNKPVQKQWSVGYAIQPSRLTSSTLAGWFEFGLLSWINWRRHWFIVRFGESLSGEIGYVIICRRNWFIVGIFRFWRSWFIVGGHLEMSSNFKNYWRILAYQLTLSQPCVGGWGGQIINNYAHQIILTPPDFQTFLRPRRVQYM